MDGDRVPGGYGDVVFNQVNTAAALSLTNDGTEKPLGVSPLWYFSHMIVYADSMWQRNRSLSNSG